MSNFGLREMFIIALLMGVLLVIIYLASVFLPIVNMGFGVFGDSVDATIEGSKNLLNTEKGGNNSEQVHTTVALAENSVDQLSMIPYVLLVVSVIFFFIIAVNIKVHPSLIIVWFGLVFVIVLISIPLSNNYIFMANSQPQIYAQQDTLARLYMENLPVIFTILGLAGGVFLFVVIQKEPEFEVTQQ